MGPIATGLGEIYMWTVGTHPAGEKVPVRDGQPGWQSDGTYLTPEGQRLRATSSGPRTCARCRTGSSARSSRA